MSEKRRTLHGWDKEPEADDPVELLMARVPGGDPEIMATCLVEEYARMGMQEEQILELFRQPIYQTHTLYRERGEGWIRDLIRRTMARAGRMRISVTFFHHIGGCDA